MGLVAAVFSLFAVTLAAVALCVRCPWPQPWWVGPCIGFSALAVFALSGLWAWWVVRDMRSAFTVSLALLCMLLPSRLDPRDLGG